MPPRSGSGPVDVDWRRLASDRNVPPAVARELWERALEASADDPALAASTFEHLLDGAAAANVTATPGRETLVGAKAPSDAPSLGPGKWTRVLDAKQPADKRGPDGLFADLATAIGAGKRVAAVLASSDQATLVDALREIRDGDGNGPLEKIVNAAGGVIGRIIDARPKAQPAPEAAPAEAAPVEAAPATEAAPAEAAPVESARDSAKADPESH